jgi:DNA-binding response OmpR family regulator
MAKILLVEDDEAFAAIVTDWLGRENHTVDVCHDGDSGLEITKSFRFDLIVLDWQLPGLSGVEVCQSYRKNGGVSPVIMLTGLGSIDNKTSGFDSGADDYLTKPCDLRELSARIRALLRRPAQIEEEVLKVAHLSLNTKSLVAEVAGKKVELLPKELALLEFFMRHPDRVFSQDAILAHVWKSDSEAGPETVRTWIKRLRKKIDVDDKSAIQTIYGVGYKLTSSNI